MTKPGVHAGQEVRSQPPPVPAHRSCSAVASGKVPVRKGIVLAEAVGQRTVRVKRGRRDPPPIIVSTGSPAQSSGTSLHSIYGPVWKNTRQEFSSKKAPAEANGIPLCQAEAYFDTPETTI